MSIFDRIARAFIGDPGNPRELDFLPVSEADERTEATRRAKVDRARQKYGKPFAPEVRVARMTPISHQLAHIKERAEDAKKAKATVTLIDRKRTK